MIDWQNLYLTMNPIAFEIGGIAVHWYGLMYVWALLSVYLIARWLVVRDNLPLSQTHIDDYFVWAEVGVILGARLGYIIFYDTHTSYYLTHPWDIFNPFVNGVFVGIRGFSYHGGLVGFIIATFLFAKRQQLKLWLLLDIAAVSAGFGYFFGRIGNFFNQELIGRVSDVPWAIYAQGALRHPSQIYEALLEGALIFVILFFYRHRKVFDGQLALMYGFLYAFFRFICEFWREPDPQIGYLWGGITMGQLLSLGIALFSAGMLYKLLGRYRA